MSSKRYPTASEYHTSLANPQTLLKIQALKSGCCELNQFGLPLSWTGGFATVVRFKLPMPNRIVALRCFTGEIPDAESNYAKIDSFFRTSNLPYFVTFRYHSSGIIVNGSIYPLIEMDWVQGLDLRNYLFKNITNPNKIGSLANSWRKMLKQMRDKNIDHGDLQHANILIDDNENIKLIDYDSIVIPSLIGQYEKIAGIPSYQHPLRSLITKKTPNIDFFSGISIYLSIISLAENVNLWDQFDLSSKEGLLFEQSDYKNPKASKAFLEINKLSKTTIYISTKFQEFCASANPMLFDLETILDPPSPSIWITPSATTSLLPGLATSPQTNPIAPSNWLPPIPTQSSPSQQQIPPTNWLPQSTPDQSNQIPNWIQQPGKKSSMANPSPPQQLRSQKKRAMIKMISFITAISVLATYMIHLTLTIEEMKTQLSISKANEKKTSSSLNNVTTKNKEMMHQISTITSEKDILNLRMRESLHKISTLESEIAAISEYGPIRTHSTNLEWSSNSCSGDKALRWKSTLENLSGQKISSKIYIKLVGCINSYQNQYDSECALSGDGKSIAFEINPHHSLNLSGCINIISDMPSANGGVWYLMLMQINQRTLTTQWVKLFQQ